MAKHLGREIRRLRTKAGITLRKFAKSLGISAAHQSDIEHGRRMPSEPLLRATAKALAHVGATYEEFKKLDTRLEPDLEEWMQRTPAARQLLREAKASRRPVKDLLDEMREIMEREEQEG